MQMIITDRKDFVEMCIRDSLATMLNLQKYYDDDPFLKVSGYREDVSLSLIHI